MKRNVLFPIPYLIGIVLCFAFKTPEKQVRKNSMIRWTYANRPHTPANCIAVVCSNTVNTACGVADVIYVNSSCSIPETTYLYTPWN